MVPSNGRVYEQDLKITTLPVSKFNGVFQSNTKKSIKFMHLQPSDHWTKDFEQSG